MINPKEGVLDRIEQSFEVLFRNKKSFLDIFLPYFFYKFIFVVIIGNIFYFLLMNFIDFNNLTNSSDFSWVISDLFWSVQFIIIVNIFLIFLLINLMLVIPFILATIKTIKEVYNEEDSINYLDNVFYWFRSLWDSFRTYWYMFVYVALFPMLVLIFWWILYIIWQLKNLENILQIWIYISLFWLLLFIMFSLYRWLKTIFSITSAVNDNEYTKENFEKSIRITDNNWWRIVWNFLLLSIIISLVFWIINSIIWVFKFSVSDVDYMWIASWLYWGLDQNKITTIIESFTSNIWVFSIKDILFEILDLFLEVIKTIFGFVFTYIFYKRLSLELDNKVNINNTNFDNSFKQQVDFKDGIEL